jgi:ERCC4-related helicase/HKD family nuclease
MLEVDYIDNFQTKALDAIRDLSADAERIDIAVAFLSLRGWLELKPSLTAVVGRGGRLRVIVRRDVRQNSPEAVEELFRLANTQVAFGLADTAFHPKDYLFHAGKKLTVLTSSANATYPGLTHNDEGGAVITHPDAGKDDAAQKAIGIFERRWQNATIVDAKTLAAFKASAGDPQFSEGDLVRSTNNLYRAYGIGLIQKVRGAQAKVEFNPSVFMPPPYRSENKILQLAEVERVDSPLDRAIRGDWGDPWRFELKMLAARFLTGNKGGQLSNARTEILPHQIFAAHRVVSSTRRRFLLGDEVGLGKTIEAGMIWQALSQRGQAKRTLIITPAGLTTQWQEEMQDKFAAMFEVFGRDFHAVNPRIWDLKATAIASIDTLKRAEHKRILLENRRWDLIIFDEAHRLSAMNYGSGKVEKTHNYRLAEEVRHRHYCDAMLLLTATPHQGEENHSRFKNLLGLLEEDIDFSGLEEAGLFSGKGTGRRFTELVIRTPKKDVTDAHGRKVFRGRQTHRMPFKMYEDESQFYKAVAEYIRDGYKMLERVNDPTRRRAAGFLLTTFQKMNASSTAAIKAALTTRLGRLKGELANLPQHAEDENEGLYDERYEGEYEESEVFRDDQAIMKGEIGTLEKLLAMRVKRDHKLDELLRLVDHIERESPRGEEEKVLIFTEYRQTQRHLVTELERKYGKGSAVVIHGGMKLERLEESEQEVNTIWAPFGKDGALGAPTTKRTSQRLFRDHERVRFLVSTEAGGEGINLQFCHICVNYDLPWNPMRVEQRVGRVYRFGQDKVVQVYNFLNKGTIEDLVQSYFENRLERAAGAIAKVTGEDPEDIKGTLNGQLESEIDPAKIYQRAMVEGDLNKQTQQEIAEAVQRARRAYEIATQSLFRDVSSYSFDSYQRELASDLTLSDLQRFSEKFLAMHRRQVQRRAPFLEFLVPDVLKPFDLPERYRTATFDRELAITRSDAEFLALGHPFVDAMLSYVGSYDFGGLTAVRCITGTNLRGRSGFLFAFIVRQRITREDGDECLFRFEPVFVNSDGQIDEDAVTPAVTHEAGDTKVSRTPGDPKKAFDVAKRYLEQKAGLWDWTDDVEFLGMSWVEFK